MTNDTQLPEKSKQSKEESNQNLQNKKQTENEELESKLLRASKVEYRIEHNSGPIPHPDMLRGYNEVDPDLAQKIIIMAEKEQNFRHKSTFLGQSSAIFIGIAGLISTTILGIYGNPWLAGGIGFLSLGSLVAKFFYKAE